MSIPKWNGFNDFAEALARTNNPRDHQVFPRAVTLILDDPTPTPKPRKKDAFTEQVGKAVQERNALGRFQKSSS